LLVGIRCPVAVNLARRQADPQRGFYSLDPDIIARWEAAVHRPGLYDLELDTSELTPAESAAKIGILLAAPPSSRAFERLAAQG
ncbi:MAG: chloramphenicol phosphotransferase, partial [Devosia nanyangense]|nr:chloramphenicol phosphotransferase [Devosia nanyangense]